ncbi:MAG: hypothetical protein HC827_03445 [Cyanobacteria bacterium RM1_2_2]|nr:hypothetical protein [Cyanobacteria bacterium RM1_2_2]
MTTSIQDNSLILADAHVHLHDCFPLDRVLDAALENFSRFGKPEAGFQGVLFLAEMANQNQFEQLFQQSGQEKGYMVGNWTLYQTEESVSLSAVHISGQEIVILAGRQLVTAEKLEVLALITDCPFADGMPLEETIETILAADGIPVLPWGVGKWIGKRGKRLQALLQAQKFPLYLGDNSGRPMFWFRSPYFQQAEAQGLRILPGTDPLPLASEFQRPGSFGFKTQGTLSRQQPGQAMKQVLMNPATAISPYGSLENPFRFLQNQLQIRAKKKPDS